MIVAMELLTVAEVATRLNVSQHRVRQLCQTRVFGRRVGPFGDRWAITEAEVERYEQQRRPPGRPRKSSH